MDQTNYYLRNLNEDSEWDRLDELHQSINIYLDGKLSFAPLGPVSNILDLGAGSGAWIIHAARLYPDASAVAADILPLPPRSRSVSLTTSRYVNLQRPPSPLPPNLSYRRMNLMEPIPLEPESFDVIHLRLLPNVRDILQQVIRMLKPQGLLLIEDAGSWVGQRGPAQVTFHEIFTSMLSLKGLNGNLGGLLGDMLQETDAFSEVNVHKVQLPITFDHDAAGTPSKLRPFAQSMTSSLVKIVTSEILPDLKDAGLTPELQIAWDNETRDPHYVTLQDFYFIWCRKNFNS